MHEIELIERARMKAAWEKAMKPDPKDVNSLTLYRDYMAALERDEWAFREKVMLKKSIYLISKFFLYLKDFNK